MQACLCPADYPCVGEIAEKVGLSVGVTSLYLKQLREAGLVSSACADRRIYYRAFPTDARGETVVSTLRRFFAERPTEARLFDLLKVVRALAHRRRNAYLRFLSASPGCGIPETAKRLGMPPYRRSVVGASRCATAHGHNPLSVQPLRIGATAEEI